MKPSDVGLFIGAIVRTSYNTGPYVIVRLITDCECDGLPPHMHMICRDHGSDRRANSYLNNYAIEDDGRILYQQWAHPDGSRDEIFVEGFVPGTQAVLEF